MKIKTVRTNDCSVVVTPIYAGNYGFCRIGGMERSADDEYKLCKDIKNNIERHIDDIEQVYIDQKIKYLSEDETEEFDELEDALISMFAPDTYEPKYWIVSGKYSEDEKYSTITTVYTFKELVRAAYDNPYEFEIKFGEVTEDETRIIKDIIEFRKR